MSEVHTLHVPVFGGNHYVPRFVHKVLRTCVSASKCARTAHIPAPAASCGSLRQMLVRLRSDGALVWVGSKVGMHIWTALSPRDIYALRSRAVVPRVPLRASTQGWGHCGYLDRMAGTKCLLKTPRWETFITHDPQRKWHTLCGIQASCLLAMKLLKRLNSTYENIPHLGCFSVKVERVVTYLCCRDMCDRVKCTVSKRRVRMLTKMLTEMVRNTKKVDKAVQLLCFTHWC